MVNRNLMLVVSFLVSNSTVHSSLAADPVQVERLRADVKYLASDRLEGRAPGTRGEELATDYIAKEFEKAGLKPASERGTFFQPVPLIRVTTDPKSTLSAKLGDRVIDFRCEDEFAGQSHSQQPDVAFNADAVFVGHGITAPEFGWDDYAGIDVKGKVVILFTNEPPSNDPKFFGGTALTYYGRWTFKFEEATRRGAKAAFIIHTTETAGYPYSVIKPLDGAQLRRDEKEPALAFAGWLSRQAGEKLLGLAGKTVEGALNEADTRGFKAVPLNLRIKGHMPTKLENIISKNVVGMIEGSDPTLKAETVMFTAHWDHLGVGRAVLGDNIYNGAADNATGCAMLMELARTWAAQNPRPKRSALFLATTAEEKGLLGALYYANHPLVPLAKTAIDLNFDMILPLGALESVVVNGAERTTAWPIVQEAARKHQLDIEPDRRAHVGIFYRSDHFALARAGVPAFSIAAGQRIKGKPADLAQKAIEEFTAKAYHTPQDEVRDDWDFGGFTQLIALAMDIAGNIANGERLPTWNPGDEFRAARDGSAKKVNVVIQTEKGDIEVELEGAKAPNTVANFLKYVDGKLYDEARFHRTVTVDNQPDKKTKIEVIQAGVSPVKAKEELAPIALERTRDTGLSHRDGVISMARDGPDTATGDFFICIGDQLELDFGGKRNPDGQGFAAFGRVVKGMDVVKAIQASKANGQSLTPSIRILKIVRK